MDKRIVPTIKKDAAHDPSAHHHAWFGHEEGRLAVDVYEEDGEYVVTSTIAGLHPDDLEVFANHDMLTIRGTRHEPHEHIKGRYLVQECHWGTFSRSVILPTEIDADRVSANLKNGVLVIRIPKMERSRKIPIETSM